MKEAAPFELGFTLDGKAVAEEASDGKLRIEGYAATLGMDRKDEAFLPGVFEKGLDKYFKDNPVLLYHHHYDQALGTVEDVKLDQKGLFVKAALDQPAPGSWAEDVYNKVKSGTIKGFSIGGIFKRKMTPQGPRVHEADFAEISVTPLPLEAGSLFQLAGKAFGDEGAEEKAIERLNELFDTLGEVVGKAMSAEKRRNAKYHFDGTDKFPIDNKSDLENAIGLVGNTSEDKEKVKAYLIRVAKALGCTDCLPEDWLN